MIERISVQSRRIPVHTMHLRENSALEFFKRYVQSGQNLNCELAVHMERALYQEPCSSKTMWLITCNRNNSYLHHLSRELILVGDLILPDRDNLGVLTNTTSILHIRTTCDHFHVLHILEPSPPEIMWKISTHCGLCSGATLIRDGVHSHIEMTKESATTQAVLDGTTEVKFRLHSDSIRLSRYLTALDSFHNASANPSNGLNLIISDDK